MPWRGWAECTYVLGRTLSSWGHWWEVLHECLWAGFLQCFPLCLQPTRQTRLAPDNRWQNFASWWNHYLCILSLGSLEAPEEWFYIHFHMLTHPSPQRSSWTRCSIGKPELPSLKGQIIPETQQDTHEPSHLWNRNYGAGIVNLSCWQEEI